MSVLEKQSRRIPGAHGSSSLVYLVSTKLVRENQEEKKNQQNKTKASKAVPKKDT